MAKLNQIVEKKPLFEGYSKTSKEDKETLIGTEMSILGFVRLTSKDGDYGVCLYSIDEDTPKTMTISTIQLEKLEIALAKVGENELKGEGTNEKYFFEGIETKLLSTKSKSSSFSYYDFE